MTTLFGAAGKVQRRLAIAVLAVLGGVLMCLGVVPMANADTQNVTIGLYERILTPTGAQDTVVGARKVQAGGRISWDVSVSVPGPMLATLTADIPVGLDVVSMPSQCAWESPNATISCHLTTLDSTVHFDAVVRSSVELGTVLKTTFEASNQASTKSIKTTMTVASLPTQPPTTTPPTTTSPPTIPPTKPPTTPTCSPMTPTCRPTIPAPPPSNWQNGGSGNAPVVISPPSTPDDAAVSLQMTGHIGSGASGKVGDPVVFDFKILNSGQVTLNSITLSTGLTGASAFSLGECTDQGGSVVTLESVELTPDTFTTCTGSSAITQSDLDAGQKVNSPTVVEAHVVDGDETVRASASGAVRLGQNPQLKLVATSSTAKVAAGDILSIALTATNTGNVTLQSVTIDSGTQAESPIPTLEPGKSLVREISYTLTTADIAAGKVHIEATVTGQTLPCPNQACGQGQTVTAIADSDLSLAISDDTDNDSASVDEGGSLEPIWIVIYGLIAVGVIAVGVVIIRSRRAARLAKVSIDD